jgi:hypothetical protein
MQAGFLDRINKSGMFGTSAVVNSCDIQLCFVGNAVTIDKKEGNKVGFP